MKYENNLVRLIILYIFYVNQLQMVWSSTYYLKQSAMISYLVNLQYHFVIIDIKHLIFRRLLVDMIDGEDALSFQHKI